MMKRILEMYFRIDMSFLGMDKHISMVEAIEACSFIRKGQQQLMADYLMLELLERGEI